MCNFIFRSRMVRAERAKHPPEKIFEFFYLEMAHSSACDSGF